MCDTKQVGVYTVHIVRDEHPDQPYNEDIFVVAFGREFYVTTPEWDRQGDFNMFVSPKFSEEECIAGAEEPKVQPKEGPEDPLWRAVYIANTSNQVEALLAGSGEDIGWDDADGRQAAWTDLGERQDIWAAWLAFREAHATWACFNLIVRYHGGGCVTIDLGEIWEGDTEQLPRWDRSEGQPSGYVVIRKLDKKGQPLDWTRPFNEIAESVVREWQDYIDGNVWRYEVVDEDGEVVEACGGYIGEEEYCMSEGVSMAEHLMERRSKESA